MVHKGGSLLSVNLESPQQQMVLGTVVNDVIANFLHGPYNQIKVDKMIVNDALPLNLDA